MDACYKNEIWSQPDNKQPENSDSSCRREVSGCYKDSRGSESRLKEATRLVREVVCIRGTIQAWNNNKVTESQRCCNLAV